MNDSLLAQSYVEAYDISYPEAISRIDDEVRELKQHLENEGEYILNDIGVIRLNNDGNYEFEPCEAGILTPELYGLSSFELAKLRNIAHEEEVPRIEVKTNQLAEPSSSNWSREHTRDSYSVGRARRFRHRRFRQDDKHQCQSVAQYRRSSYCYCRLSADTITFRQQSGASYRRHPSIRVCSIVSCPKRSRVARQTSISRTRIKILKPTTHRIPRMLRMWITMIASISTIIIKVNFYSIVLASRCNEDECIIICKCPS